VREEFKYKCWNYELLAVDGREWPDGTINAVGEVRRSNETENPEVSAIPIFVGVNGMQLRRP